MPSLRIHTAAEQVAQHLREELARGAWAGQMRGGAALARELGIGRMTADAALELLEKEGLLQSQGAGKRRLIVRSEKKVQATMRVAILFYEPEDAGNRYIYELRQQLLESGHRFNFAPKTLAELKHDPKRVAAMVEAHPAEAWIVVSGSKPVLEWFSQAPFPAFALFGRMQDLPIAGTGPEKAPALREAVQLLTDQGHRRIVMLVREERRKPYFGKLEKVFLDELEGRGIKTGPYNIPEWEESSSGLHECLDNLYKFTPPSAILIGDWVLFLPIQNYLAQRSLKIEEKTTLICTDFNSSFNWCEPAIPHIYWDYQKTARRIVQWVDHMAQGKKDVRQSFTPTKFIVGNLG